MGRRIVGLDLSTRKIGLVALEDDSVFWWGYFNLESAKIGKDLIDKIVATEAWLDEIDRDFNIFDDDAEIVVEAPLFISQHGQTNANTMAKLIAFNWMIMLALFKMLNIRPEHINVNSARRIVFGSLPKGTDKKEYAKQKAFGVIDGLDAIPKKYQDDVSDAWVVAKAKYETYENANTGLSAGKT